MRNRLELLHRQLISQGQVQSLALLAMDSLELDAFLKNEYAENPMLDYVPPSSAGPRRAAPPEQAPPDAPAAPAEEWRALLLGQLPLARYSRAERQIVDFLIASLDDRGYLPLEDEEIAQDTGADPALIRRLRRQLEQLEPPGIFAPDLQHCLLRQLEAEGEVPDSLREMVLYHLEDMALGRFGVIAAELGCSGAEVRQYAARISALNPRPLSTMRGRPADFILPDLVIFQRDRQWEVALNDQWMGEYRMNQEYLGLLAETRDPELLAYLRENRNRARLLLRNLERRRDTMRRLGAALLERQADYFQRGGPLRPMSMAALAEGMGVNVSTVSRCVRGKYIQSPRGSLPLKDLFSQPAGRSEAADREVTPALVRQAIRELLTREDRRAPLSDEALTRALGERGIAVSRRVVQKYREQLGIPSSRRRRDV